MTHPHFVPPNTVQVPTSPPSPAAPPGPPAFLTPPPSVAQVTGQAETEHDTDSGAFAAMTEDTGEVPLVSRTAEAATESTSDHFAVAHEPVAHEPVAHEPVAHEPVAHEPVAHEPVAYEPMAQEPMAAEEPSVIVVAATFEEIILEAGARDEEVAQIGGQDATVAAGVTYDETESTLDADASAAVAEAEALIQEATAELAAAEAELLQAGDSLAEAQEELAAATPEALDEEDLYDEEDEYDEDDDVVAPLRPGDLDEAIIAIWDPDVAERYRDALRDIQAHFVDDPEAALGEAQDLIAEAVQALADALLAEQVSLDPHETDATPDTESMRVAMRGYRDFLERVLAL